jgi:hypothetical protein
VSDVDAMREAVERRQITRLAHFTPTRNLVHIATDDEGLRSTLSLSSAERSVFNQQDLDRLDGYPDHISCTIQYPNAYYLRGKRKEARGEARIFPNWVCLLISPHHLWQDSTLLCPHNAAGFSGINVASGVEHFESMFALEVEAPQGSWTRGRQPRNCPTDAQAEVLVQRRIPLEDLRSIVVENPSQAEDTYSILRQLQVPLKRLSFVVCPQFYEPTGLAAGLSAGRLPVETPWHPPKDGEIEASGG